MISLLMFSGGIDSTYALYKLLRETDDEVLVHHIHLMTNAGRYIPEAKACRDIIAYCQKTIRPFLYSESTIDHRRFQSVGYDMIAAGFEAGVVACSYRVATKKYVDQWIVGLAADDAMPALRLQQAQDCCVANCQVAEGAAPKLFTFPRVELAEQVRYLPAELLSMTWSCRFPKGVPNSIAPCGRCKSCERRTAILPTTTAAA